MLTLEAVINRNMMYSSYLGHNTHFFFQYVKCWDNICTAGTLTFDMQGSFSSITYTQGEGRVECGSTVGIHTICTQLRHWSKGRSFTIVPDIEGNLSEGRRPAMKERTQPTLQG